MNHHTARFYSCFGSEIMECGLHKHFTLNLIKMCFFIISIYHYISPRRINPSIH